jgi:hypothetical protein
MSDAWFEFPPLGGGRRVAAALINSMTEELWRVLSAGSRGNCLYNRWRGGGECCRAVLKAAKARERNSET